jgi:cholest-4-en-3-one 26-monooxygenase
MRGPDGTWPADANILDPDIFPMEKGPPHALFKRWRESDPVHWNPATPSYVPTAPASSMTRGFWVLTRYQDVFDVSRDQERFSSYDEGFVIWDLEDQELALHRANFMGMRPAHHGAVKQVVLPAFSPKAMQVIVPEIDRLAVVSEHVVHRFRLSACAGGRPARLACGLR